MSESDQMTVIAFCTRCGRGWLSYRDYGMPCRLAPRNGRGYVCGGRVVPLVPPVPNHGQDFWQECVGSPR